MGAFFLYHRDAKVDLAAVRRIHSASGFTAPREFDLGEHKLLLYRKQLVEQDNFYVAGGSAVFSIGTPVYRGLSYRETLQKALEDLRGGVLDQEQFLGNFCLIFRHQDTISILLDALNVRHIFRDAGLQRVSSSFLALLVSYDQKLPLNRSAFYEKVTTGLVMAPDTLVSGISQVVPAQEEPDSSAGIHFLVPPGAREPVIGTPPNREQSLAAQLACLQGYMRDISALCSEYRADVGLSGGYDSRLLYALIQKLPGRLAAYTHATSGVHEHEVAVVREYLKDRVTPLTILPTKPAWQYSGHELEGLLKDCLTFFDGRSGSAMSAFSPVYTRSYRIGVMGENRVNLNGSGGEIYRNYSHTGFGKRSWLDWMRTHVYFMNIPAVLGKKGLLEETHRAITQKINIRLQLDFNARVDYRSIWRYLAEINMPDSKGVFAAAQNQLGFYLNPFMERGVVQTASLGIRYHGMSGDYEADLIEKLDPSLAGGSSSYGFPLNAEPALRKTAYRLKGLLPEKVNAWRHSLLRSFRDHGAGNLSRYRTMLASCAYMGRVDQLLSDVFPEINWSELVRDGQALAMVSNLGPFLLEYESHIQF